MSRLVRTSVPTAAFLLATLVGCASGRQGGPAELPPAAVANIELRMVGSETTWVARGAGYELAARSQRDIVWLQPLVDRQATAFRAVFDTVPALVQAAVEHATAPGTPSAPGAVTPIIPSPGIPLVTLTIGGGPGGTGTSGDGDAARARKPPSRGTGRGSGGDKDGRRSDVVFEGAASPLRQLVRAWLSARASALTSHSVGHAASAGVMNDPRVPAWAEDALLGMTADSTRVNAVARELIASDSLYPLDQFFTMLRPPIDVRQVASGGARGAGDRPSQGGGGTGGRGGGGIGGGMGGRGGGGARGGGMGGGGRQGQGDAQAARPNSDILRGGMLFNAEALVLSHCLTAQEGTRFVGTLIDAQMTGKPLSDAVGTAKVVPADLTRLDDYWRRWMAYRLQDAHGG
ncbi:MAG: hypothetical protein IPF98_03150 [Gemmatimonadetes bacterium]|nr:hypothetical protein [Gemmatimonadota bacterium]